MNPLDEPRHEDHVAERTDAIIDLALGQPVHAQLATRIRSCSECIREVEDHARTIRLIQTGARGPDHMPPPPASVWSGISAELGIGSEEQEPAFRPVVTGVSDSARDERNGNSGPAREATVAVNSHPITRRRIIAAAAAVVVIGGAGAIGYAVGTSNGDETPRPEAEAPLRPQPGTSDGAEGTATVRASTNGRAVDVRTSGLPDSVGYYEVWLFDPVANKMVGIGTLGSGHAGSFTVPAGLNLDKFHIVDVSAQKLNGDNRHQRSVLRGTLR